MYGKGLSFLSLITTFEVCPLSLRRNLYPQQIQNPDCKVLNICIAFIERYLIYSEVNMKTQLKSANSSNISISTVKLLVAKIRLTYIILYTVSGNKRGDLIFNYNSRISWSIFIIFVPLKTGMNTLQPRVIYLNA